MNEKIMFFFYLFVMAGVTYLIRMIPLVFCQKEIRNRYVRSFLYYVPYSVLTAMIFPAIFYSTGMLISAVIGTITAAVLAYFKRGLLTVAIGAGAAVFLVEAIMSLI